MRGAGSAPEAAAAPEAVAGSVPEAVAGSGADRVDDPDTGGDESRHEPGQFADSDRSDDARQRR